MNFVMNLESGIVIANLCVFAVVPYLPNVVYNSFVETYVGAILLLVLALYSITYGYLVSVSTFTAVASLFAESHARKARKVKGLSNIPTSTSSSTTVLDDTQEGGLAEVAPVAKLVPSETHPDVATPDGDEAEKTVSFTGKEDDGVNVFKPVDVSINEKTELPTISLSKEAAAIYEDAHLADKNGIVE